MVVLFNENDPSDQSKGLVRWEHWLLYVVRFLVFLLLSFHTVPHYFYDNHLSDTGRPEFDFTVDEGKEWLNPSRDKNQGTYHRRKVD